MDLSTVCVIPADFRAELDRESIRYIAWTRGNSLMYSVPGPNLVSVELQSSHGCVTDFRLQQLTHSNHYSPTPLVFTPDQALNRWGHLSRSAQRSLDPLFEGMRTMMLKEIDVVGCNTIPAMDPQATATALLKRLESALISRGVAVEHLHVHTDVCASRGSLQPFVTVDALIN